LNKSHDLIGWTEAEFSKKEKKVVKKILVISISLGLSLCLTSFCFIEDSMAEALAKERTDAENKARTISSPDQAPSPVIRLTGGSSKKLTLPPPCSVVGISGKKVTLRDFYGKVETVEVEEVKNIKVGDKVVVKNGMMRLGVSSK
jgi:hypothetical protein